ncbi:ABC transporter substrate-binding protein [Actinoplanes sp. DH11]|uniref:ABC transporter substrate-binding protein n=1 Tax=Actinoplanes sp. DH11 TaxID=2857011 RepID=UPI001E49D2DE|nr:sugar ABC transporter substrate-binding protein [Actinoplanes sp. DH11]
MRKIAATALLCTLTAGLAACGGGQAEADGPITLRMTTWSANPAHVQLFDSIAAEYKQSHPDVTVTFEALPLENYTTTVTTQIAGGNAPDMAWILESAAPDFVSSGALAPLDDAVEEAADLAPSATALWKQDGKLMAYPFSTSPFGVFVNTDLLKQAGQSLPAGNGWTWDNVVKVAGATAAKTGKQGVVVRDFDYKDWTYLATVFQGWGARAWSEDGKTCGFDQKPMVDAMTFLHQGIFTGKAFPAPGVAADFFAGESAMTIAQISRASLLKDAKFGWDLVPLPAGPAGDYSVIGQGGLGVLRKSENAAAASEFVKFFTSPANSAKLAQFFPPPRTSQLTAETLGKANPLLKPEQLQDVVVDGIANGVVKPSHTGSAEITQAVRAALDPLWKPGADVPGVLRGVCTAISPLLAK